MDFNFDNDTYRVERGIGTGRWLLLHYRAEPLGWLLLSSFDAGIDDNDIIDAVKSSLRGQEEE